MKKINKIQIQEIKAVLSDLIQEFSYDSIEKRETLSTIVDSIQSIEEEYSPIMFTRVLREYLLNRIKEVTQDRMKVTTLTYLPFPVHTYFEKPNNITGAKLEMKPFSDKNEEVTLRVQINSIDYGTIFSLHVFNLFSNWSELTDQESRRNALIRLTHGYMISLYDTFDLLQDALRELGIGERYKEEFMLGSLGYELLGPKWYRFKMIDKIYRPFITKEGDMLLRDTPWYKFVRLNEKAQCSDFESHVPHDVWKSLQKAIDSSKGVDLKQFLESPNKEAYNRMCITSYPINADAGLVRNPLVTAFQTMPRMLDKYPSDVNYEELFHFKQGFRLPMSNESYISFPRTDESYLLEDLLEYGIPSRDKKEYLLDNAAILMELGYRESSIIESLLDSE